MRRTMTIWFVAAIPALIMFFALAMERLEHRLRYLAARENLAVQETRLKSSSRRRARTKCERCFAVVSRARWNCSDGAGHAAAR